MNLDSNLLLHGHADVSEIAKHVAGYSVHKWNEWEFRQKTFGITTKYTRTIPFLWTDNQDLFFERQYIANRDDPIYECIAQIVARLEAQFEGVATKVMLVKLFAGEKISVHVDGAPLLVDVHRCHIPIVTNDKVVFKINDGKYYLEKGSIYEINNVVPHGVDNNSDVDRVHLMVDIVSNTRLGELRANKLSEAFYRG
jgi:aspartyl/asparaginyl beta-hydroxylase (cupin superfamily)